MKTTKNGVTLNKVLMVGSALVSLNGLAANNAHAAAGTGGMSAVILSPITVSGTVDIYWGNLTVGTLGGNASLDTADTRGVTGDVLGVGAASPTSGQISLSGELGVAIVLSVDAAADSVSNGAVTMVVNAFNVRTNTGGLSEVVTLTASPTSYPVGATLVVGASQATGTYTGAYGITATYQ